MTSVAAVGQTKQRILREAIEENVREARGHRTRTSKPAYNHRGIWFWGLFLVVCSLGYLFAPSYVVSTGLLGPEKTPPSTLVSRETVNATPSSNLRVATVKPEIALPAPQPLNRAVFPLAVKKIVIDPGHGGEELGAVSHTGVAEKELTLDIAIRLQRLMEQASFEALLTRKEDETVPLSERAAFANYSGADLFVSIHINWMKPTRIRPLETYYLGPTEDPESLHLASVENRDSGYSLSDFRRLLEKVYIDARRGESHKLAKTIHGELFRSLSKINPALQNRGVKMAPFVVLVATEMPAILVEVSCLSNEEEVKLLTNADYREQIALALFKGVRDYARALDGSGRKGG